ncbi:MutS-related protein [Clostridium novyi]|uniref:MutS-related protein n=1 Tax=Clostridium novyi TaxID=1542 RepID=UPI000A7ED239|nr:DNA mismatch repair protein MutS [Clostridium novyi]
MDDVYCSIDRTFSTPGEQHLYKVLRTPLYDKSLLEKRNELISFFQDNSSIREKISLILHNLGKTDSYVDSIFFEETTNYPKYKILCYVCSFSFILSLFMCLFWGFSRFGMIALSLSFINMFIHYSLNKVIREQVLSMVYLGNTISAAASILYLNCKQLKEYNNKLNSLLKTLDPIRKNTFTINRIETLDIVGDYVNIMFLIKEINYFKSISTLIKHKKDLLDLYLIIGKIDTLISIASFRDGLPKYTKPNFVDNSKFLSVTNLEHPLIQNAIPNSIDINNFGIIITGSNMSGKSTFLRTVGVNALLAQTIYTCIADSYSSSIFNIITSIKPGDDLLGGKSYYLAEAEALLRIINASNENIPCLCMIDEIYRGTNPIERINASYEILNYLSSHNALTLVATHDLQLTKMTNGYKCYYFKEDVTNTGLTFDYKIKEGISPTRNAVKILKFLGYPSEIINKTEERIKAVE